jgi:hypothetical protein
MESPWVPGQRRTIACRAAPGMTSFSGPTICMLRRARDNRLVWAAYRGQRL